MHRSMLKHSKIQMEALQGKCFRTNRVSSTETLQDISSDWLALVEANYLQVVPISTQTLIKNEYITMLGSLA